MSALSLQDTIDSRNGFRGYSQASKDVVSRNVGSDQPEVWSQRKDT